MNNSSEILDHDRFLVFGAARSGLAAARLLRALGKHVAVYDEAPPETLEARRAELEACGAEMLAPDASFNFPFDWEVMVLSPGVPVTHPIVVEAEQSGCLVRSEIEIGFRAAEATFTAITGTNGKTTVTHLVAHMLGECGVAAHMAGNVGRPLCDVVMSPEMRAPDAHVVCEVSSFQLETIERFAPRVACVLNVAPDHLDRHGSLSQYVEIKYRITENQGPDDVLVVNADEPLLQSYAARTAARVWKFSLRGPVAAGAWLADGGLHFRKDPMDAPTRVLDAEDVPIPGRHNLANVLAALTVCAALDLDPRVAAEAVRSFRAVPHRIEFVGEIDGVRWYNDSKATNLESTRVALESFEAPVVLIAGGRDKGAPWSALNDLVAQRVRALVLLGEATPLAEAAWGPLVPTLVHAADMTDAVARARAAAGPGDVVLLSPACASFDMFRNYEERGDVFRAEVRRLAVRDPQTRSA